MSQEITNSELRDELRTLITTLAQKQDKKIDTLTTAVNDFATDTERRLQRNEESVELLKQDVGSLKQDMDVLKQDVGLLKQGQEEIKLRMSRFAYRFDVDELGKRVVRLERKAGLG